MVDALVSGTSGSNALEVQVLLSAPRFWGCSSVDRALRSHRRGRGFESHQLHQNYAAVGRFFCCDVLLICLVFVNLGVGAKLTAVLRTRITELQNKKD